MARVWRAVSVGSGNLLTTYGNKACTESNIERSRTMHEHNVFLVDVTCDYVMSRRGRVVLGPERPGGPGDGLTSRELGKLQMPHTDLCGHSPRDLRKDLQRFMSDTPE